MLARPCRRVVRVARVWSVLAVRVKVVRWSGLVKRCRVMALGAANLRSPSGPWMRPKPDCLTPPKGRAAMAVKEMTEFTATMPASIRRASSRPRVRE